MSLQTELSSENVFTIVPFWEDPSNGNRFTETSNKLYRFIRDFRDHNDFRLVLVDDGSGIDLSIVNPDIVVRLPQNTGKANAVRTGLRYILDDKRHDPKLFVQYNGDADQSALDPPALVRHAWSLCEGNPNIPSLVIGDRYSDDILTPPNLESIKYRQTVLILQNLLSRQLGYDIKDMVSGSRAYTPEYARRFLQGSRSERYGIEVEQIILASLMQARVGVEPLTDSRERDPDTESGKLMQSIDAIIAHGDELAKSDKIPILEVISAIRNGIQTKQPQFQVGLEGWGFREPLSISLVQGLGKSSYTAIFPDRVLDRYFPHSQNPFHLEDL